jgi:SAM-dependent methyltransferase
MTSVPKVPLSARLQFEARPTCPLCGGKDRQPVWEGRFDDPTVRQMLDRFHYSADLHAELGDERFALVRCSHCDLLHHARHLDPAGLVRLYRDWTDQDQVHKFEAEHGRSQPGVAGRQKIKLALRLHHLARQRFPSEAELRVLDFGCGNGEHLLAARLIGFAAVGIDLSDSRAAAARIGGMPVYPGLDAFDAAGEAPLHAVILSQVLEHLTDPLGLLRAITARMAPGGVMYIGVPDCTGVTVPKTFHDFHNVQPLEHLNCFTPATLDRMAATAGLNPLRRPATFLGTSVLQALRSAAGLVWQPRTTDRFYAFG